MHYDDQRKRGRAGQRERHQILAAEPLCYVCLEQGRTTASEEVDHKTPLSQGGSDERENKGGICKPCHRAKTAAEAAAGRRGRPTGSPRGGGGGSISTAGRPDTAPWVGFFRGQNQRGK